MPELKKVAEKSALQSEPVIGVNVEGWRIALVRLGDEYYALEDDCPHERCHISDGLLEGDGLICPCHGSVIDVKTGRVETGPAIVGSHLDTYQLQVDGDDINLVWS